MDCELKQAFPPSTYVLLVMCLYTAMSQVTSRVSFVWFHPSSISSGEEAISWSKDEWEVEFHQDLNSLCFLDFGRYLGFTLGVMGAVATEF